MPVTIQQELPQSLLMDYLLKAQEAHQSGDRGTATKFYTLALKIDPDCVGALNNLAMILAEDKRFAAAGILSRRAVAQAADQALLLANHGAISIRNEMYEEATSVFRQLVTQHPREARFWQDLGFSLMATNMPEAMSCWERASELAPADSRITRDLGLGHLIVRDWDRGFQLWRRSGLDATTDTAFSVLNEWHGEPLHGKTVVVYHEQGFGDSIQFCRFLKLLEAERVILAVPSPLVRLLRTSVVADEVIDFADPAPPDVDYQVPLLFAWAYRSIKESLEEPFRPYLKVPPNGPRVHRAENTLLTVGVCWRGNPLYGNDSQRSMPFEELAALAATPGVQVVSLQKGSAAIDVHTLGVGSLILDPSGQVGDFADLAYVVDKMDLVVSVDTAALHLAGALGKPALALLPYNRCWRWGRGTEETPFYPSMRLVTQRSPGDWSTVMFSVRAEIDRLIGDRRVPPEPQTDYELLNVPTREF